MKNLIKEWGLFTLFILVFGISRLFFWQPVRVDGHSMDPTLAHNERLIVLNHTKIDRFDMVVAKEEENGQVKEIVKRVIGMPGDTISYKNDTLYVNGKKKNEPYLKEYLAGFKEDKLNKTYSYNALFQELAKNANAFTIDSSGQTEFTVKVPKGQYFLLGDDRIVSRDSREVGTFKKDAFIGEVKFRYWPLNQVNLFN
ncbi:S26 family signal peptidase [Streptococcus penaeicida]|uniref:Signal peptidase I n=1 Tax=Streptococcus penaeicida TaxID=1765960 RepID=A0A2N8LDX2_9STRE|nr:signal peptidase I [Streptococcus penaeicida]PND48357.1 S26 family signal peptidase [Streptococcus penaeicida]